MIDASLVGLAWGPGLVFAAPPRQIAKNSRGGTMSYFPSFQRLGKLILTAVFALALPGYAQNITGSMSGRVIDQQGASIPNAAVTVTEPAKRVTATQKTT